MSAREAKNVTAKPVSEIDEVIKDAIDKNNESNIDINVEVNTEINEDSEKEVNKETDRLAKLKAKLSENKKKEVNKQVTVYLTPTNYKRFNQLKAKGQKSELINQLLDLYFED